MHDLPEISSFFVCSPECPVCLGEGHVCEDHPDRPWAGTVGDELGCDCGGAGMPCPSIEPARQVFTADR